MSRSPNNSRRNAGFTLVEIMVVMAIMGVLLGLALMNFHAINQKAPLEQAVSDLEGLCRRARTEAIVKSRPMDLTLDSDGGRFELATAPHAQNARREGGRREKKMTTSCAATLAAQRRHKLACCSRIVNIQFEMFQTVAQGRTPSARILWHSAPSY